MAVWRYTGYLMGIPETILYTTTAEAEEIYKISYLCEPSGRLRFGSRGERFDPGHSFGCRRNGSGPRERVDEFGLPAFTSAHRKPARQPLRVSKRLYLRNAVYVPYEATHSENAEGPTIGQVGQFYPTSPNLGVRRAWVELQDARSCKALDVEPVVSGACGVVRASFLRFKESAGSIRCDEAVCGWQCLERRARGPVCSPPLPAGDGQGGDRRCHWTVTPPSFCAIDGRSLCSPRCSCLR